MQPRLCSLPIESMHAPVGAVLGTGIKQWRRWRFEQAKEESLESLLVLVL